MNGREKLQRCLRPLSKHIQILCASGDAAFDQLRPNEEEIEDQASCLDDPTLKTNQTYFFETRTPSGKRDFTRTPALYRTTDHLFQYFLDGTVHGRAIGTGMEGSRSFPLALFQIGVAIVRRHADGNLFPYRIRHDLLITTQGGDGGISDSAFQFLQRDMGLLPGCEVKRILPLSSGTRDFEDIRGASNGTAFGDMHAKEIEMCQEIMPELSTSCRAIVDGTVKLGALIHCPFIVGIAKSFWHMPRLRLTATGDVGLMNLIQDLAALPEGCRTPIYAAQDGNVGFWFVRLRAMPSTFPLDGVVKVELPCPTKSPVDSDEADYLSRAIIAERSASAYGIDKRWHRLLYPIHMAEAIIKSGFMSTAVIDRIMQAIMRENLSN